MKDIWSIPAWHDFTQTTERIAEAQEAIKEAREDREQSVYNMALQAGDDADLRHSAIWQLYWAEEDMPITLIMDAFNVTRKQIQEIAESNCPSFPCSICGANMIVTTRSGLKEAERQFKKTGDFIPSCPSCTAAKQQEQMRIYQEAEQQRQSRLQQLKTMPYREYLQTPEWQQRRAEHLKRAHYRCQVCNAGNTQLNVHHRTYERRGNENMRDLIVLCRNCHEIFHQQGKLKD